MSTEVSLPEFWAQHALAGPANVVLAIAMYGDGRERNGIFSTIEKAQEWGDRLRDDEQTTHVNMVFSPYVIDVPEYGNVPKKDQQ